MDICLYRIKDICLLLYIFAIWEPNNVFKIVAELILGGWVACLACVWSQLGKVGNQALALMIDGNIILRTIS